MDIENICQKMSVSLAEFKDLMVAVAEFYDMTSSNEEDKIFLCVLAKIRDLNNDEFNMYKIGGQVKVITGQNVVELPYDDKFYDRLFMFLEQRNLNFTLNKR